MHIVEERAWIRTRGTRGCSRFRGECLKPDSAISPYSLRLVPAGGIEPPRRMTLRFECSASSIPPGRHIFGRSGGSRTPKARRRLILSQVRLPVSPRSHNLVGASMLVPEEGVEPSRSYEHSTLDAACLPFHHPGITPQDITLLWRLCRSPLRAMSYKLVVRDAGLEPARPKDTRS